MGIRTKLILILGLVLILNFGMSLYSFLAMQQASAVYDRTSLVVVTALKAQVSFKKQVQEWKDVLLRGNHPAMYEKYLEQFYLEEEQTRALVTELIAALAHYPRSQAIAEDFLAAHDRLGLDYRRALALFDPDLPAPHRRVDAEVRGIDRKPTDLLDKVVDSTLALRPAELAAIADQEHAQQHRLLGLTIGLMIGAIFLVFSLTNRHIARPIAAATTVAQRIASGDLGGTIPHHGNNEAGQMLAALARMQSSLAEYQATLRNSEERTRLLLDSSGEGIYGVDRDGRCMFVNPAALSMLGYREAGALLGREMHALMHHSRGDGTPYPSTDSPASRTHVDGSPAHIDDELFWRADGGSFPVEYRSFPIRRGEELIGAVVTFADITARRDAENAVRKAHEDLAAERAHLAARVRERTAELHRANAELARTSRAKDEFLAAMSHELRTPLTTVIGITEMLGDQLYGSVNDKQTRALETVQESANHLMALINDILDVAKVEAGKMELDWDTVPVEQLCEASLRLVRQAARAKHLELSTRIDPAVRFLRGDSRRLKQVLVNLLGNAVKFTPDGGAIGLDVEADPERGRVHFTVWDTGIGIQEDQMNKLFEPFVQLDSKLSRQYTGTGLGLALVYRMTELHGGSVSVESTPGNGSRFHFFLPWTADGATPVAPRETGSRPTAGLTDQPDQGAGVLLADDNSANAAMIAE